MVEEVGIGQLQGASCSASFGIRCAINHALNSGVADGSHTHDAGLQRHKERCSNEAVILNLSSSFTERFDFCMRRGVMGQDGSIPSLADHLSIESNQGSNGHFTGRLSFKGKLDGPLHQCHFSFGMEHRNFVFRLGRA